MTAGILPISTGGFFATSTDQGVSEDATLIRQHLIDVLSSFYESSYIRGVHELAHEALREARADAMLDNWDGYGARAVTEQTFRNAFHFLRSLPSTAPSPEVSPEPDGEIAFEWYAGHGKALSISIGEGDTITFAGMIGRRTFHGTEPLIDELPETILQELGRTLAA